jgi:hypothetical protein
VKGIRVVFPWWLKDYSGFKAEAMQEIDAENIPEDWVVIVELPTFTHPNHGLVRGVCDYTNKTISVGWRMQPYEDRPFLRTLKHEVNHIHFGPEYGH